jgi:hypothetical protein
MVLIDFPMEAEARALQFLNALLPMLVTEPGMVTVVRVSQFSNALSPMLVVPSGTSTWPFASGVIQHPASAMGSTEASVSTVTTRISVNVKTLERGVDDLIMVLAVAVLVVQTKTRGKGACPNTLWHIKTTCVARDRDMIRGSHMRWAVT